MFRTIVLRVAICCCIVLSFTALIILAQNLAIAAFFPHLARTTTDFSPAYLRRELQALAAERPEAIFLGDSVLWGYRLRPDQTAVQMLATRGCTCRNLSLKSGNPANEYLLTRLLLDAGARPKVVVIEVNQAVLNWGDPYYQTLHPAIGALAQNSLTPFERAELSIPGAPTGIAASLDRALDSLSLLYAMRSDIRETLYGDVPPPLHQRPRPEFFAGTYNLARLDERNVGVHFLEKTADLLRDARVPLIAVLTPTNHALLHTYIDNPLYEANTAYLRRLFASRGARVLDLDSAFAADQFFDNVHLTQSGQSRLASALAAALPPDF